MKLTSENEVICRDKLLRLLVDENIILNCIILFCFRISYLNQPDHNVGPHVMNKLDKKWLCFNFEEVPYLKMSTYYGFMRELRYSTPYLSLIISCIACSCGHGLLAFCMHLKTAFLVICLCIPKFRPKHKNPFISVPVLDREVLNAFLECMFSVNLSFYLLLFYRVCGTSGRPLD